MKIIIIAGPNGAGKTTFAKHYLTAEGNCPNFINADLIAAGLSPFAPEKFAIEAGKLLLSQIAKRVEAKESFAFETTLSGHGYARHIPRWQAGSGIPRSTCFSASAKCEHGDQTSAIASPTRRTQYSQGGQQTPI